MIFSSTYVPKTDPLVTSVSRNSATGGDREKDRPREDPPKWSTLQQIPSPEGRLSMLNDYIMAQVSAKKERSNKSDEISRKYHRNNKSDDFELSGNLFSAVA